MLLVITGYEMNKAKIFIVAALAVMLLAGCKKDKVTLNLSDSDVTGAWRKDGTSEYWCYCQDGRCAA